MVLRIQKVYSFNLRALLIPDDDTEGKEGEQPEKKSSDSESEVKKSPTQPPPGRGTETNQLPHTKGDEMFFPTTSQHQNFKPLSLAEDLIRTVENPNRRDDVEVYDFIKGGTLPGTFKKSIFCFFCFTL